jgi:hypothetical protein
MAVTPNMGLTTWPNLSDVFNHTQLAANFTALDTHDHTSTKGVQVGVGGLAPLTVGTGQLQDQSVATTKLADLGVTTAKLNDLGVTTGKLAALSVTPAKRAVVPIARVRKTVTQTIPDNTSTNVTWTVEDEDTDSIHDNVTNSDRLTVNTAGVYLFSCKMTWGITGSSGSRILYLGTNLVTSAVTYLPFNAGDTAVSAAGMARMSVGDYALAIVSVSGAGSSQAIVSGNFGMVWLSN